MSKGREKIQSLFSEVIGKKAHNVKLGYGTFVTIDFGKNVALQVPTNKGMIERQRGEWHLWAYICAWRLDKNGKPLCGSSDEIERDLMQKVLDKLNNKKLLGVSILSDAFDLRMTFEGKLQLQLFSETSIDHRHWMLYISPNHVFIAGPGAKWSYKRSDR